MFYSDWAVVCSTKCSMHLVHAQHSVYVCYAERKGEVKQMEGDPLRWLPRVSTKVIIQTVKTCKRSPSSVVLISFILNFTSKVTNLITLVFQVLLLRHRPLSWQQSI